LNKLLLIDTSTDLCSVALAIDNIIVSKEESNVNKNHAASITLFIQKVVKKSAISLIDIDAIAINAGPGSYTGLRIGMSSAKGICYALNKPLITIDSLQANANAIEKISNGEEICVVLDNRRDEFFYAIFNSSRERLSPISLGRLSDSVFLDAIKNKPLVFTGSAIEKIKSIITSNNKFITSKISASNILKSAINKWDRKEFASVEYSEPLYYKDVFINEEKPKNL
jgi:tRNA threonylcarbamoyladenosine biosynthesis protein TsaB